MGIGKALSKGMGLMPAALSGAFGEKNKGFGLGILPGMLYKQNAKKDEAEERAAKERNALSGGVDTSAPQPLAKKAGGKIKETKEEMSVKKNAKGGEQELPQSLKDKMEMHRNPGSKGMKEVKPSQPGVINPDEKRPKPVVKTKSGGEIKGYKSGGTVSSASKRADGCAVRGKTKGKMY